MAKGTPASFRTAAKTGFLTMRTASFLPECFLMRIHTLGTRT